MADSVRVWEVAPHPNRDYDYLVVDSAEAAGRAATEAAELAWDGSNEAATTPGPAVTIRCYEMPRDEFEALEESW